MKTQELNAQELREINGGSFLGNSDGTSGLGAGLGIDNLLSFSDASKSGDDYHSSSFSVGNGISTSLQQLSSSIFN